MLLVVCGSGVGCGGGGGDGGGGGVVELPHAITNILCKLSITGTCHRPLS